MISKRSQASAAREPRKSWRRSSADAALSPLHPGVNRRDVSSHSGRHALLQLPGARQPESRLLYFDCFSGISGDMTLGALLDAGLPLDDLRAALGSLALDGVELSAERVLRAG